MDAGSFVNNRIVETSAPPPAVSSSTQVIPPTTSSVSTGGFVTCSFCPSTSSYLQTQALPSLAELSAAGEPAVWVIYNWSMHPIFSTTSHHATAVSSPNPYLFDGRSNTH